MRNIIKNKLTKNKKASSYDNLVTNIGDVLSTSRKLAYQTVNSILTITYWEIGKQIVEFEQGGKERAEYGEELIKRLSSDLTSQFDKGFSYRNLQQIKKFYSPFPIVQTVSAQST